MLFFFCVRFVSSLESTLPSSSSTTTPLPHTAIPTREEELISIILQQEQLISSLQTEANELREMNQGLTEALHVIEGSSSSSGSGGGGNSIQDVGRASASILKREVLKLTRKIHTMPRPPRSRRGDASSDDDGDDGNDSHSGITDEDDRWLNPQTVKIVCKETTEVSVKPLSRDDSPNDECLVLEVRAPDLDAKFVLYCDRDDDEEDGGKSEL